MTMGTREAFRIRESLRRARTALITEHETGRAEAMAAARKWRQWAFDNDDIGALYQADAWVKCARRCNHHALIVRRDDRGDA